MEYKGHLDRFVGTTKDYDWRNPLEALAGGTHVVTSGFGLDPLAREGLSFADASGNRRVSAYNGILGYGGKTTQNIFGTLRIFRGDVGSALGGLINLPGDALSDVADGIAGVKHNKPAHLQGFTRAQIDNAMNN